jgi:hypothetical protein
MYACSNTRLTVLLSVAVGLLLAACSGGDQHSCQTSSQCSNKRLCVTGMCLAPDSDSDFDGLTAAREVAHGLMPGYADSDGDGIGDGLEWGDGETPRDTDGDGIIDALESLALDRDNDCLPDSLDAHNDSPDDIAVAKPLVCPKVGVCADGWESLTVECRQGTPVCVFSQLDRYQVTESWCDSLDNDCDGLVDEASHLKGLATGAVCTAPGTCGDGTVECNPESLQAVCSSGPQGSESEAKTERCDGLDNDCDGLVDEGQNFAGLQLGEPCTGFGICGEWVVECRASDASTICSTMAGGSDDEAQAETCDGIDNNCNGTIDEELFSPDLSSCPNAGVCASGREHLKVICDLGSWVCDPGGIPEYTPDVDGLCDGLDNDCDGSIDEDFQLTDADGYKKELGSACGAGPCAGGIVVCAEDALAAVCSTWGNLADEVCDGQDNDCDGLVDEGQLYQEIPVGESCKGMGQCGVGVVECSPVTKTAVCSTNADGSASQATVELCDQLDNDCDSEIDEGIGQQPLCDHPGVCLDKKAIASCQLGEWICDYSSLPDYELQELACDDLDNDCDGQVDEKLPKVFDGDLLVVEAGPPSARWDAARAVDGEGGLLHLSGGKVHPFPWPGEVGCHSEHWRYDVAGQSWTRFTLPQVAPRHGHALVVEAGGTVVLAGGRCGNQATPDGWRIGLNGVATTLQLPAAAVSRWGHLLLERKKPEGLVVVGGITSDGDEGEGAFAAKGSIDAVPLPTLPKVVSPAFCIEEGGDSAWLFGGQMQGEVVANLWRIDLESLQVENYLPPYRPEPRTEAALLCGERIYLLGGVDGDGELTDEPWQFDPETEEWAHWPDAPGQRRMALAAVLDDSLTVVGGIGPEGLWSPDRFQQSDGLWEQFSPNRPGNLAAVAHALDPVSRQFCLVGGFETGVYGPVANGQLWCRSLEGGEWNALGDPVAEPLIFATMSYDPNAHRFLVIGGAAFPQGEEPQPLSPVCRYLAFDLTTLQWSEFFECDAPVHPGARSAHAAAVRWKDLGLWLYGGIGEGGLSNSLWRYGLDTGTWTEVTMTPGNILPERYGHGMWIREDEGELLIMGSASSSGAAFIVDLKDLTVSAPISVPGWFDFGFAPTLYDVDSAVGFLIHPNQESATRFVLQGGTVVDGGVIPLSNPSPTGSHAATAQDKWQRQGMLFGGIDGAGTTRGDFAILKMTCQ